MVQFRYNNWFLKNSILNIGIFSFKFKLMKNFYIKYQTFGNFFNLNYYLNWKINEIFTDNWIAAKYNCDVKICKGIVESIESY